MRIWKNLYVRVKKAKSEYWMPVIFSGSQAELH